MRRMAGIGDLTADLYNEIWEQLFASTYCNNGLRAATVFRSLMLTGRRWTIALIRTNFFQWNRIAGWSSHVICDQILVVPRMLELSIGDFFEADGRVHWPLMFREWDTYSEDLGLNWV